MQYTKEHYEFMDRLAEGVIDINLSEQEQEILRYLYGKGIAKPRADIQDGLWVLSQDGRALLQTHEAELSAKEALLKQEPDQAAKETAEQIAAQKSDRAFQIFLVLLGAAVGLLFSNLERLIAWIASLF